MIAYFDVNSGWVAADSLFSDSHSLSLVTLRKASAANCLNARKNSVYMWALPSLQLGSARHSKVSRKALWLQLSCKI